MGGRIDRESLGNRGFMFQRGGDLNDFFCVSLSLCLCWLLDSCCCCDPLYMGTWKKEESCGFFLLFLYSDGRSVCLLQLNQQPGLFIMPTKQPILQYVYMLDSILNMEEYIYWRGEEETINVPVGSDALNKEKKRVELISKIWNENLKMPWLTHTHTKACS